MRPAKTWRHTLARILATLLAVGFILLAPVTVLAHSVAAVVYSPDVMALVLARQFTLAEDIRRPLFETLLGSDPEQGQGLDLSQALVYLTPEEQRQVLASLIPERWAQDQIEAAVYQAYAWLDSEEAFPTLTLDVRPVKVHLLDSAVQAAVSRVIESWPDCTTQKLAEFAASLLSGEPQIVYCAPGGAVGEMLAEFLTTGLIAGVQSLPPEIVLTPGSQRPAQMLELKQDLQALRAIGRWGWVIPCVMLLLIIALVVRTIPALGRWWGWPLLAAGLLSLASLLGGGWLWRSLLREVSATVGGQLILNALGGVLDGLAAQITARQLAAGGLLMLLGIGLLVVARVYSRRSREPAVRAEDSTPGSDPDHRPSGMFG